MKEKKGKGKVNRCHQCTRLLETETQAAHSNHHPKPLWQILSTGNIISYNLPPPKNEMKMRIEVDYRYIMVERVVTDGR